MNDDYILEAIEAIDNSSIEAEISIMNSLINAYVKEYTMLQYTEPDVVQEALKDGIKLPPKDKVAPPTGRKGESLIKKIVMFIPRLLVNAIILILKGVDKFAKFISGSKKADEIPEQVPFAYKFYISMAELDEPDAWLKGMVEIFQNADDDIFVDEHGDTFADRLFKCTTLTQINIFELTEKFIKDMREAGSDEDMTKMIPWTADQHKQLTASNKGFAGQPRNIARQMRGIIQKLNEINSEMKDDDILYSGETYNNIMKLRNDIMYIVNVYNKANQACNPPKA